jgi:hypothetical protein
VHLVGFLFKVNGSLKNGAAAKNNKNNNNNKNNKYGLVSDRTTKRMKHEVWR